MCGRTVNITGNCCNPSDSHVTFRLRRGQRQSVIPIGTRGNCAVQSQSFVYRCKKLMRGLSQPSLSHLVSECRSATSRPFKATSIDPIRICSDQALAFMPSNRHGCICSSALMCLRYPWDKRRPDPTNAFLIAPIPVFHSHHLP